MIEAYNQRVTIERTSLSKETYTVKHPRKIFPSCNVFRGVDAWGCRGEWFGRTKH